MYRAVGKLLAKYKSGKIPKAMKVLPRPRGPLPPPPPFPPVREA